MKHFTHIFFLITLLLPLAACSSPTAQPATGLRVVATTTLVGDVIHNIGGEAIQLSVLLPVGTDPHSFQPTPQDAARLADADLIFTNGAGLETFMQTLLQNSGSQAKVVDLSAGITLLQSGAHDNEAATGDPHVWTDPNNVIVWVKNAEQALSQADPAHAAAYQANAAAYSQQLVELDAWIQQQVSLVPAEQRKLVMDHEILGYFAKRYGFEQVGAVIPGFNTLSEPSAQELATLEDAIRSLGVPAIFVSFDVSPALAERVANDTSIKLVYLYSGSLSKPGGPADNYINFTRYNVNAITGALR